MPDIKEMFCLRTLLPKPLGHLSVPVGDESVHRQIFFPKVLNCALEPL